jgi:hypothetical protein
MGIGVLALDGVFALGRSAVLDAFHTANELAVVSGLAVPRFEVRMVTPVSRRLPPGWDTPTA